MQALNVFFYHVALGRVETSIRLPVPYIFADYDSSLKKHRVYSFDPRSQTPLTSYVCDELKGMRQSIQVGRCLFYSEWERLSWCKLERLVSGHTQKSTKASPVQEMPRAFAMTNYKDRLIFITGGISRGANPIQKAQYYCIESDTWSEAPNLCEARSGHNSCALKDYVYVAQGESFFNVAMSIERLNVEEMLRDPASSSWETLSVSCLNLRTTMMVPMINVD